MIAKSVGKRCSAAGARSVSRGVSDKIDRDSFVQEYTDDFYPNLNREEFKVLLEYAGGPIKGKATIKGTQLYSLRNPKSITLA